MKYIAFILFITLNISCSSYNFKHKEANSSSDSLVAETTGYHYKVSKEEQARWNKLIQDIDTFVYRQQKNILNKNQKGKTFLINAPDSLKDDGVLEYEITYLGSIYIKRDNIRFLYTTSYAGNYKDSQRASSGIDLYNRDKHIGQYYVGGGFNTPPQISESNLIVKYHDNDDCNQTTAISFKDSIPQEIYIKCTEKGGDIYTFEKR